MSRYINTDFILDGIKNDRALIKDGKMDNYKEHYLAFLEKCVELTPSIDIVRCKECKYEPICNHSVQHTTYDAHSITIGSKTVEWCSYGERREP